MHEKKIIHIYYKHITLVAKHVSNQGYMSSGGDISTVRNTCDMLIYDK